MSPVFLVYDHLLTFDREVELFWKRKFTGATALFLLNRYILVLDYIFNIATIERSSEIVSGYQPPFGTEVCVPVCGLLICS